MLKTVPKKCLKSGISEGRFFQTPNRSLKIEQTFIRHLPMYRVKAKLTRVAVFAKSQKQPSPGMPDSHRQGHDSAWG